MELIKNTEMRRWPVRQWVAALVLVGSFFFLYGKVLITLSGQWRQNVMYSHGFLIPLISLYLVWVQRDKLSQIRSVAFNWVGYMLLAAGLLMHVVGDAGGIPTLQQISLPFTLTGVVVSVLGLHFLKVLWLPVAYLFFMIPIWEEMLTGHFHSNLQQFSADNGVVLLNLFGIPAYQEGLYITLPNIVLEVARACSGVNHLIAVIAIGIPLAYLFVRDWKRRVLLICVGVLIAILANGLRVALIGLLSYYSVGNPLHGPFHILQGLFVSAVGYAALFLCAWFLSGKSVSTVKSGEKKKSNPAEGSRNIGIHKYLFRSVLVALVVLTAGSYIHFRTIPPYPLKKNFHTLPIQIAEWTGTDISDTFFEVYKESGVDHEIRRVYKTSSGDEFQMYVGYFEYQDQKKKLINYRTTEFHKDATRVRIDVNGNNEIETNGVVRKSKGKVEMVCFWYEFNGWATSSHYVAKGYTIWNAIINRRTNGAIMMIKSEMRSGETLPEGILRAERFIKAIYPTIVDYLPVL